MLKAKVIAVLVFALFIFVLLYKNDTTIEDPYLKNISDENIMHSSPEIQMYFFIKKYSKQYSVPEAYAFTVAFLETGYQGPLHKQYNHAQSSYAGAVGPMQIMPSTANWIHKKSILRSELKNDIHLNVKTSMMVIEYLYKRYHDWGIVFGYYNTGYPCVNSYAKSVLNKEYIWKKS